MVEARGGGVRGLGEGPGYLFGDQRGIVLITHEAEEWGRWGLGGEEVVKEGLSYLGRREAPGKCGNRCGGRPNANLLAVQRQPGVAEVKKSHQCVLLAEVMALKYDLLELFILL